MAPFLCSIIINSGMAKSIKMRSSCKKPVFHLLPEIFMQNTVFHLLSEVLMLITCLSFTIRGPQVNNLIFMYHHDRYVGRVLWLSLSLLQKLTHATWTHVYCSCDWNWQFWVRTHMLRKQFLNHHIQTLTNVYREVYNTANEKYDLILSLIFNSEQTFVASWWTATCKA